jgi:glucosamine--fructose-6-phosphate aminotransferase (isomerizing)
LKDNIKLYDYGWGTKGRLAAYYAFETLINPGYWGRALGDGALAFFHSFVAKDDFLYLYQYYPWREEEVDRVLNEQYQWEADEDYGKNQWRMGDLHTAFINYIYYTVAGFSEFDNYRAIQVREGLLEREEALQLVAEQNETRLESLRSFALLVGFNLETVLKRINAIPKLY